MKMFLTHALSSASILPALCALLPAGSLFGAAPPVGKKADPPLAKKADQDPADVAGWREFKLPHAGLTVKLPAKPDEQFDSMAGNNGPMEVWSYFATMEDADITAFVTTNIYGPDFRRAKDADMLSLLQKGMVKSFEGQGGKVSVEKDGKVGGFAARDVAMTLPTSKFACRFIATPTGTYTLGLIAKDADLDSKITKDFFASFKPEKHVFGTATRLKKALAKDEPGEMPKR